MQISAEVIDKEKGGQLGERPPLVRYLSFFEKGGKRVYSIDFIRVRCHLLGDIMDKNLVKDPVFTDEAVKLTGKSRTNLYYYIHLGEIPSYTLQIEGFKRKRRVFERAELMAWIAKQEESATAGV